MPHQFSGWKARAGLAALAGLLGFTAFVFLFVALYLGLRTALPGAAAALLTGLIALVLALLLVLAERAHRPHHPPGSGPRLLGAGPLALGAGQAVGTMIRAKPLALVGGAVLTGFLFAASPRLRRFVWRLLL